MRLTLAEAATRLGLSASTLRNQIHKGRLRGELVGKTWTVTAREVERYRADSAGRPGRHAASSPKASSAHAARRTPTQ